MPDCVRGKKLLERINILKENFSEELPLSPLHWMISDKEESLVVESVKEGLKVYKNPVGVLANNPSFDYQIFNLNNYMCLSTEEPQNSFSKDLELKTYSRGMGALGLPGVKGLSRPYSWAKVRMRLSLA